MQYLGIDWGTRRRPGVRWMKRGTLQEGTIPAEQDGLARLALTLGAGDVLGCIEMMSGAVWARDQLAQVGWDIRLADARKVKAIAPLRARPIGSTRACSPTWCGATWCRRCGSRRSRSGPTASGCDAVRI